MPDKQQVLLIFEIDNAQDHYARCMELIMSIERDKNLDALSAQTNTLTFFENKIFRIWFNEKFPPPQIINEELVQFIENTLAIKKTPINMSQFNEALKSDQRDYAPFYYYFRISFEGKSVLTDEVEFLYYGLMAQSPSVPMERVFSLMNCTTGDYYSLSSFTQFVPDLYKNCFSCHPEHGQDVIRRYNKQGETHKFVPLIEINKESFNAMNTRSKLMYDTNSELSGANKKTQLQKAFDRIRPVNKTDRWLMKLISVGTKIIERSFHGTFSGIRGQENELAHAVCDAANALNVNGVTALQYLIFACSLSAYIQDGTDWSLNVWAKECFEESIELTDAINQILENVINHAKNQKGLLTFRIHEINKHLPYISQTFGVPMVSHVAKSRLRYMQVVIADTSNTKDIIETFLTSDEKPTDEFQSVRDRVRLSDFLGEYAQGEARTAWTRFRAKHRMLCLGLLKFANGMKTIGAVSYMRSAKSFRESDSRRYWLRDFRHTDAQCLGSDVTGASYIPGTQISVLIPIKKSTAPSRRAISHGVYDSRAVFQETFLAYAMALDGTPCVIDSSRLWDIFQKEEWEWNQEHGDGWSQLKKDTLTEKCRQAVDSVIKDCSGVIAINMVVFCQNAEWLRYEQMCKGLLASRLFDAGSANSLFIAGYNSCFKRLLWSTLDAHRETVQSAKAQIWMYQEEIDKLPFLDENDVLNAELGVEIASGNWELVGEEERKKYPSDSVDGEARYIRSLLQVCQNDLSPESGHIANDTFGYRIGDTHMRLGNKAHLDAFFEIAPHFMRQSVAKTTAYFLLARLFRDARLKELLKEDCTIVFYGYAAYSRAVVSSMDAILQEYIAAYGGRDGYQARVQFAVFQVQKAGETMDSDEQIYLFDKIEGPTSIIQVVPISSTMTTFKKMWIALRQWNERRKRLQPENKVWIAELPDRPECNQTVIWVRDNKKISGGDSAPGKPSDLERAYWDSVTTRNREVITKDAIIQNPMYIVSIESTWRDPLKCNKCFPQNPVMEFPLIETDDSSTIPAQQFYLVRNEDERSRPFCPENEARVASLRPFLKYGHILRGLNHYRYYIDMQRFFRTQKKEICDWLSNEIRPLLGSRANGKRVFIVSPQKSNNIEFSQCVDNQVFDGNAHLIYFDAEKHFRSNVEVEFYDLFGTRRDGDGARDLFIYSDSAIITGGTFHRIRSLLSSLVGGGEAPFAFDYVISLVNRLSPSSQKAYVADQIHSYVQLEAPNMRNYGDSCVSCKLRDEANRLHKESATKLNSRHWKSKKHHHRTIRHDNWDDQMHDDIEQQRTLGYMRLMFTHRANDLLKSVRGREVRAYADFIGQILNEALCLDEEIFKADVNHVDDISSAVRASETVQGFCNGTLWRHVDYEIGKSFQGRCFMLESCIKVLSRPFFTFDYKIRCCMTDFLMLFVSLLVRPPQAEQINKRFQELYQGLKETPGKEYILNDQSLSHLVSFTQRIESLFLNNIGRIFFIRALLHSLADMQVNFVYRKDTIQSVSRYLADKQVSPEQYSEFIEHYIRYILHIVSAKDDERRALWLEHLLLTGAEYHLEKPMENMSSFTEFRFPEEYRQVGHHMLSTLLIENGTIHYHVAAAYRNRFGDAKPAREKLEFLGDTNYWNFCRFMLLDRTLKLDPLVRGPLETVDDINRFTSRLYMMQLFDEKDAKDEQKENGKRYESLRKALEMVVNHHFGGTAAKVMIVAKHDFKPKYLEFDEFFFVALSPGDENEADWLKNNITPMEDVLKHVGFNVTDHAVVIKLDNHHDYYEEKNKTLVTLAPHMRYPIEQKIYPLYICLRHPKCKTNDVQTLLLAREVLLFRDRLVQWLVSDFNNSTMSEISRIRQSAMLLVTDKAGAHSDTSATDALQDRLMRTDMFGLHAREKGISADDVVRLDYRSRFISHQERYGLVDEIPYLLLLSHYVNTKIARLYRAMVNFDMELGSEDPIEEVYRRKGNEHPEKKRLDNIGDAIFTETSLSHTVELEDGRVISMDGYSRRKYFEHVMQAVTVHIGETSYDTLEALEAPLTQLSCIHKTVDGYDYGYCSEQFACLLLDYFFSAMQHGVNWTRFGQTDIPKDIVSRLLLLRDKKQDRDSWKENGCHIYISIEDGKEGGDYRYLVLSNRKSAAVTEKSNGRKRQKMSLLSFRWYIDSLWRRASDAKNGCSGDVSYPIVEVSPEYEPDFYVKLPILKPNEGGL